MIDHETGELVVPAHCPRGHELTARTTHIATASGRPTGWTCVRCVRLDLWHAHYDDHSNPDERGKSIPPQELAETRYQRQNLKYMRDSDPSRWTKRVRFASGWGYDREDPTPEVRRAIREAAEKAERDRATERARQVRMQANADLLTLCLEEGAA